MSINSGAGGWLAIWLFTVDGVFVNFLGDYISPSFLTLGMSCIGARGGGRPRLRLAITVEK